jgi:hypothetical protein
MLFFVAGRFNHVVFWFTSPNLRFFAVISSYCSLESIMTWLARVSYWLEVVWARTAKSTQELSRIPSMHTSSLHNTRSAVRTWGSSCTNLASIWRRWVSIWQLCFPHSLGLSSWLLANPCTSMPWCIKIRISLLLCGPFLNIHWLKSYLSNNLCSGSCVLHFNIR